MKLLFLGVSSALVVGEKKFQSNMLIESMSGRKMLIDCGTDVRHSLYEQGIHHGDIDAVYVSHLHADHVGGLEWLGFSKFFIDKKRPELYISPDQQDKLWSNVLSGGMSSLENVDVNLSTYFDVRPIDDLSFMWEKCRFQLIAVYHSIHHHERLPCYGLLISGQFKKIFISTDTRFCPELLMPIYNAADVIFHDCETAERVSGQHAQYTDLKTLDVTIKNKMWLYDYNDDTLPDAVSDGFKGFVVQGQSFEF
ncbi:MAG TPA: MBL fold hydrolase [Legionella sp.]|nr:MBL fold hydrolase [Legionella sp.]